MSRPERGDYAEYFDRYVSLVPDGEILGALEAGQGRMVKLLAGVAPGGESYRYGEGKWTVREVLGHVIDTERVFAYRALRLARGDQTPLPPFDQDIFVAGADFERLPLAGLIEEFTLVRRSTIALFRHLTPVAWGHRGEVDGHPLTPKAAAWIIAGHQIYHEVILRERYGAALTDAQPILSSWIGPWLVRW